MVCVTVVPLGIAVTWIPALGVDLQYSTSTAWQSGIIRRLCHSQFSHVDIIVPGEGLMGVSGVDPSIGDLGGVRIRPFNAWPYLRPPKVAHLRCTDEIAQRIIANGRSQLGKPFDNDALWDFLSDHPGDRDWRAQDKWFCSEFAIWCLETGGFFPYPLIASKNRVTPADSLIMINPFMVPYDIEEFGK
jgi:hypothetical protein